MNSFTAQMCGGLIGGAGRSELNLGEMEGIRNLGMGIPKYTQRLDINVGKIKSSFLSSSRSLSALLQLVRRAPVLIYCQIFQDYL